MHPIAQPLSFEALMTRYQRTLDNQGQPGQNPNRGGKNENLWRSTMWTEQHFLGLIMISVLTLATLFASRLAPIEKGKENTNL